MGPEENLQITRAAKARRALWHPPAPEPPAEFPKPPKRQRPKPRYEFEPCEYTPIHRNALWAHVMRLDSSRPVLIEDVIKAVCLHYKVQRAILISKRRSRFIARARQVGMYLCRELTANSFPEIGRRFGGRDHTTVLHGIRKIEQLLKADPEITKDVRALLAKLKRRGA